MDMGDRRQESLTAQVRSYYEAHIAEIQECLQEAVDEVFNVQPENLIIIIHRQRTSSLTGAAVGQRQDTRAHAAARRNACASARKRGS